MNPNTLVTLTFGLLAAGQAWATTVAMDRIPGYFSGDGGELNAIPSDLPSWAFVPGRTLIGGGFETFSLEINEPLGLPGTYTAVVNTGAVNGGVAGGNPDILSIGTATLYEWFANGTLAGYNYTPGAGREASAAELQAALWWLEDEIAKPAANTFVAAVELLYGGEAASKADYDPTTSDVRVLNLYDTAPAGAPSPSQDVPWMVQRACVCPDGGLTVLLLGFGLAGLASVRRRLTG